MSDTIIIIPGTPIRDISPKNEGEIVLCGICSNQMMLSTKKLASVYNHFFIDDKNLDLDVMCYDCLEENVKNSKDNLYRKKFKIISI